MSSANSFELFIALRYLRAKRKQTVISVITIISVIGVAAGVMALVIGIAINNGFRSTLQRSLLGATAHVMLLEKEPGVGISNWTELDPKLQKLPHVTSVSPVLYSKVILLGPPGVGQPEGAELKGIPLDSPPDILRHLKQGSFEDLKNDSGLPGIILGSNLAEKTGRLLHSVVTVVAPQEVLTPLSMHLSLVPYQFRVVGIFESGFYEVDSYFAFTSLNSSQVIFSEGNVVNSIELQLDDIYKAPEVELFNAGEQTNSESPAIPTIPPSQICNICTHFGFGMICGGVLALKGECQSEEDRARWAVEARDRKGFEEQAFQPSYAALAESARSCASCLLFHACLPDPTSYIIDETRPVTIRAGLAISKDKQRDLSNLKVGLPIKDTNYPAEAISVYGQVGIYGSHGMV